MIEVLQALAVLLLDPYVRLARAVLAAFDEWLQGVGIWLERRAL